MCKAVMAVYHIQESAAVRSIATEYINQRKAA